MLFLTLTFWRDILFTSFARKTLFVVTPSTFKNFFSMVNSPSTSRASLIIYSNNFGSLWINIWSISDRSKFFFKTFVAKKSIVILCFQILSWQSIQILLTIVTLKANFVVYSSLWYQFWFWSFKIEISTVMPNECCTLF